MRSSKIIILVCASAFASACTDDSNTASKSQQSGSTCESWEVDSASHTIWPPNHKLYRFSLDSCVTITDTECLPPGPDSPPTPDPGPDITPPPPPTDSIDPPDPGLDKPTHLYTASTPVPEVRLSITSITSNEPIEVTRGGDGHTTRFDARIVDDTHFELRAERQGAAHGRTYTVNFVDQSGVTGACTFVVPHDNGSCVH